MHRALAASILAVALATPASALYLYGVTGTHLVEIDPTDPSRVRTIGPHGLTGRLLYGLDFLPAGERLIGLSLVDLGGGVLSHAVVEYDSQTGVGTLLADLGTSTTTGHFDSLAYVDVEGALVASFGPTTNTNQLVTLDPDTGATSPIVTTGAVDIDAAAYDDVRDLYYAWDPNGAAMLEVLDRGDGGVTPVGAIGATSGNGTFSEDDGGLFLIERGTNSLLLVETSDGFGPITLVDLGVVASGEPLRTIAFSPVPEPVAAALLPVAAGILAPFARRRRVGHP
jgi:hypothetical protein